jgi:hypothetical protein
MSSHDGERLYSYHWSTRVILYAFVLICTASMLLMAAGALVDLLQILSGSTSKEVAFLIGLGVGSLMLGLLLILFTNIEPNIRVSNRGVAVQTFLFWYVLVPWQDVIEIRRTILPFSKSRLVVVRRLTPFHRLIGWTNGLVFQPAFVIRRGLKRYDEAIETIKEETDKHKP